MFFHQDLYPSTQPSLAHSEQPLMRSSCSLLVHCYCLHPTIKPSILNPEGLKDCSDKYEEAREAPYVTAIADTRCIVTCEPVVRYWLSLIANAEAECCVNFIVRRALTP
jgi:hypothetical protein